jgi:hypothetical protein
MLIVFNKAHLSLLHVDLGAVTVSPGRECFLWCPDNLPPRIGRVAVSRILGKRTHCHEICISLLLIASAVQGITPDDRLLASLNSFIVVMPFQDFSDPSDDQEDPAEEFAFLEPEKNPLLRLLEGRHRDSMGSSELTIELVPLRSQFPVGSLTQAGGLIILLCSLNC